MHVTRDEVSFPATAEGTYQNLRGGDRGSFDDQRAQRGKVV